MTDLTKLSDAELMAAISQQPETRAQADPTFSDAQRQRAAAVPPTSDQAGTAGNPYYRPTDRPEEPGTYSIDQKGQMNGPGTTQVKLPEHMSDDELRNALGIEAPHKPSFLDDAGKAFTDTVTGSAHALMDDLRSQAKPHDPNDPFAIDQTLHGLGIIPHAIGTALSPLTGAVAAVSDPMEKRTRFGGSQGFDLGEALSAAMPSKALPAAAGEAAATAQRFLSPMAEKVGAFDRAGVRPTLAAMNPSAGVLAKVAAETPIVGNRARAALQSSIDDTAASADKIAAGYGQATTRGAAGEAVQQGVQDFNSRFSNRASKLYDKAFAAIDEGQSNAVRWSQRATDLKGARMAQYAKPAEPVIEPDATQAVLQSMGKRVNADGLSSIIDDPRVGKIASALSDGSSDLRFGDLRALRTWVREAQKNPELRQGIDQAGLQRMEGALTTDMATNAARMAGPDAARRLKQADQFYRLGSQRIEGALQAFVGKGGGAPKSGESAYDLITRAASDKGGADTARLSALKKSLVPHEWGDVASTVVSRLGQPTPGAADQGFSVNRFVTNYNTLSEEGKGLLFGKSDQAGLRSELDNLARVAEMQKAVERAANTSNTATATRAGGMVAAATQPHLWAPVSAGLAGMTGVGEALTNARFVRWLAGTAERPATAPQISRSLGKLRLLSAADPSLKPAYQHLVGAFGPSLSPASSDRQTPGR